MADSFDFTVNLFLENFHTAFEPKAGFMILPALLIASFTMAVCRKPGTVIFVDFRFNFNIVPEKTGINVYLQKKILLHSFLFVMLFANTYCAVCRKKLYTLLCKRWF